MTTINNPHGWPDPARPGYPTHPERDGWHWLLTPDCETATYLWRTAGECERGRWPDEWVFDRECEWNPAACAYLGPCLTPAEVAAAVQAEREMWFTAIDREADRLTALGGRSIHEARALRHFAGTIRARGPADALAEAQKAAYREGWNDRESDFLAGVDRTGMVVVSAEALAQARREGMEKAAVIAAERGAWASNDADAESLVDRLEANGRMEMAAEIAAAIREAAGEEGK